MEILLLLLALVLALLLWFFKPTWLRQELGRDPKPPHLLPGMNGDVLRNDPKIGPTLGNPDQLAFHPENRVPSMLQQGYTVFLTPDGEECYCDRDEQNGTKRYFLLRKPPPK